MNKTGQSRRTWCIGRALQLLAACCLPWMVSACATSQAVEPDLADVPREKMILGVQTHFAFDRNINTTRIVEWIRAARIDSTRDEMFWNQIEDSKGVYGFRDGAEATRRAWWNEMPRTSPLLILGYGNPHYDEGGQPKSSAAVKAYSDHAEWLVGATRSRVRMVEIWNEWNIKAGTQASGGAQGSAEDYVRLASATVKAVKAADPAVLALVGGLGDDYPDWRWMRTALPLGLLEGADGVSVHLYNHCNRALVGADEMMRRLEALQSLLTNHARRPVSIYLTEVGWPTHRGPCQVGEADAGTFSLRLLLEASLRPWLKGVWMYETIDSGEDPTNREHRFGLLSREGRERPSGCMVRTFGALVSTRPTQVMRLGGVTAAVYREAERSWVFVWNREGSRGARVRVDLAASTVAANAAASGSATSATSTLPGAPDCQLPSGTMTTSGATQQLRADLDGAIPAVFVLSKPVNLVGVRLD